MPFNILNDRSHFRTSDDGCIPFRFLRRKETQRSYCLVSVTTCGRQDGCSLTNQGLMSALSKSIPLLLLPLGSAILILLATLRWRHRSLIAAALLILWLFGIPAFSDRLMSSLEDQFPYCSDETCPKADAIFVFGGMLSLRDHSGTVIAWNEAAERFDKAVNLYKTRRAPILILSGGPQRYKGGPDEGELLRARAVALGIPSDSIIVTGETFNTKEEASLLRQLVAFRRWRRVLIVTSAYHMRRAMLLSAGCFAELIPVPVAFTTPDPKTSWAFRRPDYFLPQAHALLLSELALREYLGILIDWAAGITHFSK